MELPKAPCPMDQGGKEALGTFTGGCIGQHLGATVKDRTQQGPIPNAWIQGSETLHMLPFPLSLSSSKPAQKCSDRAESTRQLATGGWKTIVHALDVDLPAGGSPSGLGAPIQGFQRQGAVLLLARSCVVPLKGCEPRETLLRDLPGDDGFVCCKHQVMELRSALQRRSKVSSGSFRALVPVLQVGFSWWLTSVGSTCPSMSSRRFPACAHASGAGWSGNTSR